ncbi:hypothetical protein [Bdellovibrio sp. HCB209]|uniref:hypothetical protein n=1 Tax=Bdellovibrio sp. HCB209 TaxID=3394354 RepID=UPI0039B5A743
MKNSFWLLLCGIFLSVEAGADSLSFRSDVLDVLHIYSKLNDVGLNKPSNNFMGFSIRSDVGENQVMVYHADSPVDVILNGFTCTAAGCDMKSRDPRCFYYTPGGSYSAMDIYDLAFKQLQQPRDWVVDELKFWQLGHEVYGRISNFQANQSERYTCSLHSEGLICESTSETPDEP